MPDAARAPAPPDLAGTGPPEVRSVEVHPTLDAVMERVDRAELWWVAVDMPIGLRAAGPRPCDAEARRLLGPRRSSVLPTPARVVLDAAPADLLSVSAQRVEDLTVTLLAAEAAGLARWTLNTATEYAKVREQFGKPIGSFQAIKHMCSEMLLRSQQIAVAANDVAEAAGEGDGTQLCIAAAVAAAAGMESAKPKGRHGGGSARPGWGRRVSAARSRSLRYPPARAPRCARCRSTGARTP